MKCTFRIHTSSIWTFQATTNPINCCVAKEGNASYCHFSSRQNLTKGPLNILPFSRKVTRCPLPRTESLCPPKLRRRMARSGGTRVPNNRRCALLGAVINSGHLLVTSYPSALGDCLYGILFCYQFFIYFFFNI